MQKWMINGQQNRVKTTQFFPGNFSVFFQFETKIFSKKAYFEKFWAFMYFQSDI